MKGLGDCEYYHTHRLGTCKPKVLLLQCSSKTVHSVLYRMNRYDVIIGFKENLNILAMVYDIAKVTISTIVLPFG